jgi:hypothetical protein
VERISIITREYQLRRLDKPESNNIKEPRYEGENISEVCIATSLNIFY